MIDNKWNYSDGMESTFTNKYLDLINPIKEIKKKEKKSKNYKEVLILDILIYLCEAYHHLWHSINYRHENEIAYQQLLKEWEESLNEPQEDMYEFARNSHATKFNILKKQEQLDSSLKTKIRWAKLENKQSEIYKYIVNIFDDWIIENESSTSKVIKELEIKIIEKNLRNSFE